MRLNAIPTHLTRRAFVAGAATMALSSGLNAAGPASGLAPVKRLIAGTGKRSIVGPPHPVTAVWSYNGASPGPELRYKQGERLDIEFENALEQETTVHWHGIRLPNAMDGVPHLTQPPVPPGGRFRYTFDLPDAGTYWYHPHQSSSEQVARGLAGPLVIEEPNPPKVDRDLVWVLSDWRLGRDAQLVSDFGNRHDMSHGGRIGNTVTLNGAIPETFDVRAGERIRLRLINAANARIFALEFEGHSPQVIAYDGQPVSPHSPAGNKIVLGPAMRADVILDITRGAGERFRVIDSYYQRQTYRLVDLVYGPSALRDKPLADAIELPANPLAKPDLGSAITFDVRLSGGAMGMMRPTPEMIAEMRAGRFWFLNGVAATGHVHEPIRAIERGRTCRVAMINETAWDHPMHLHGHSFEVISRNGVAPPRTEWRDTVLVEPRERVEIAFVADNPGDWMFHCHVLEHQMSGMMGVIRVT